MTQKTVFNLTTPDVREAAKNAGKPTPEGWHYIRVQDVSRKDINDKPAWELHLIIMPGEPNAHATIRDKIFWTESASARALLVLSAFGYTDQQLAAIDINDERCWRPLIGATALVEVRHSKPDSNGNVYANPTYAGYKAAHKGAVDEMRREREAAPAVAPQQQAPMQMQQQPPQDYGPVPF